MKSNLSVFLTAAAFCLAAWSCSDENSPSLPPAPEIPEAPIDPDALCTITPRSVAIAPVDVSKTPLTRSATGEPVQEVTYAENIGHNSSMEATLEAMPQEAQTRAVGLGANVQYRIVAYDNTKTIVGNVVYKQGSTTPVSGSPLQLKVGTYRLFCYSFNKAYSSTETIRGMNSDNTVTVNNGDDFMTYTLPNFTVTLDDCNNGKTVSINFIRQCAKLTLTIKAQEYTSNNITAASAALSNVFGSAKWSGTSNIDSSPLATGAGAVTLTKASGNGTSVDCGINSSTLYAFVSSFSNQTIEAKNVSATIDGTNRASTSLRFPNPVTLAKGGTYRLTIVLGNYYVLTSTNPVTIGDKKWARTNLQQTGNGVTAPVSFVANPWDKGSYWNWALRDATLGSKDDYADVNKVTDWTVTTAGHVNQDPCRSINGNSNTWRLPTDGELKTLLSYPAPKGVKVKINSTIALIDGNLGMTSDETMIVFIDGNQCLALTAKGYRDNNVMYNNYAYYWSSLDYSGVAHPWALWIVSKTQVKLQTTIRNYGGSLRCLQY